MPISALLLACLAASAPLNVAHRPVPPDALGDRLAPAAPIRLSVVLRSRDPDALAAFLRALRDPRSPSYRRFITPAEFGARFGEAQRSYAREAAWLRASGLEVETSPGRLFLGASGTAAQIEKLLGVELRAVREAGRSYRTLLGSPRAPAEIAARISLVEGLETRPLWRRHLAVAGEGNGAGPQDLRRLYDLEPLLASGVTGSGTHLATFIDASPNTAAQPDVIAAYLSQVSDSSAQYAMRLLPGAYVNYGEIDSEADLDVEMLSASAPGAATITQVVANGSATFSTGINDIVNNLPETTVVSVSLGACEAQVGQSYPDLANGLSGIRALLQQGLAEGITWFASTGDSGANSCGDGIDSVQLPASLPELVAVGGTQIDSPVFDAVDALIGYQPESVYSNFGFAGGGGVSGLFAAPAWQAGLTDGGRGLPDLSALAGTPFVAASPAVGTLTLVGGTSVSAPFVAGVFALVAEQSGCKLGDIHPTLYMLGQAQLDGGATVFNDVTAGNNGLGGAPGYAAGPGYDLATGWGSPIAAALAAAWPTCPGADAGPLVPYDPCAVVGCANARCQSVVEGPSFCAGCDGGCPTGERCSPVESDPGASACVARCETDADCPSGQTCFACAGFCELSHAGSAVGATCAQDADCAPGQWCLFPQTPPFAPYGQCSLDCDACGMSECPAGSICSASFDYCLPTCTGDCPAGTYCDDLGGGTEGCIVGCGTSADCAWAPGTTCLANGTGCVYPDAGYAVPPLPEAGPDAGPAVADGGSDAGSTDAGRDAGTGRTDAGSGADGGAIADGGAPTVSGGCRCAVGTGDPAVTLWLILGLGALLAARLGCLNSQQRGCRRTPGRGSAR